MTDTRHRPWAVGFAELLRYEREELAGWERYFAAHPDVWDFPFAAGDGADARMATIGGAVHHIIAVERRYADRLDGSPLTEYAGVPASPPEALFEAGREANARLARWVEGASADDLARTITFKTLTAGTFTVSTRRVVAHAIMHGVRTWAQIATVVRQHGVPSGWGHDLLMSDAIA